MRTVPSRLWLGSLPLLLASASPTRRAVLESAGFEIETEASDIDERALEASYRLRGAPDPMGLAGELAREKALTVSRHRPDRIVLGADQVLELGGDVLHKAADPACARRQLARLAGRTHALHSAAAIARDGAVLKTVVDTARLTMRPLAGEAIEAYLALAGEDRVLRTVGGYEVERLGIHLFERIDGDHATVLGLPLFALLAAFRSLGLLAF